MISTPSPHKKAGHRSWAPKGSKVSGGHTGDIMSPEKRSAVMSKIRSKDTGPERVLAGLMRDNGISFESHAKDLAGSPDFVFRDAGVAVFVDGDFWHGWRFPLWKHKLSNKWKEKITKNRARDQRNHCKLKRDGWKVIRIWEHQIEKNAAGCLDRVRRFLNSDFSGQ